MCLYIFKQSHQSQANLELAMPAAKGGLELLIFWPLPLECCGYGCVPPHLLAVVLGMAPQASYILDEHLTD